LTHGEQRERFLYRCSFAQLAIAVQILAAASAGCLGGITTRSSAGVLGELLRSLRRL